MKIKVKIQDFTCKTKFIKANTLEELQKKLNKYKDSDCTAWLYDEEYKHYMHPLNIYKFCTIEDIKKKKVTFSYKTIKGQTK